MEGQIINGVVMRSDKSSIKKFFESGNSVEQYKMHKDYNLYSRRRAVFDLLKNANFRKVADLGCGSGGYLDIKKQYDCLYFGLDFSENMVNAAANRAKEMGIEKGAFIQQGNVENTPYEDNFFDLVLAIGLIEYFENPDKLIKEIKRILRQGGILTIQSFIPNPYVYALNPILGPILDFIRFMKRKGNKIMHKKYTKGQLDDLLLKNGFQPIDFAYSNFHLLPSTPLNMFFQKIHIYFSEQLAKRGCKKFGFFAVNYIGKYQLTK